MEIMIQDLFHYDHEETRYIAISHDIWTIRIYKYFDYIVYFLRRITDITSSVLVGQGEPAHLECAVDANPMNKNTIRWERKGYDMAARTKTTMGKFSNPFWDNTPAQSKQRMNCELRVEKRYH